MDAPRQPNVTALLLSDFTSSPKSTNEIRHGFVECLEFDVPITRNSNEEEETGSNDSIESTIKDESIKLLMKCLPTSAMNLDLYLLGFDNTKVMGHSVFGNNYRPTNDGGDNRTRLMICKSLERADFDIKAVERPKRNFLDNSMMDQLFKA